jgi:hypothetical protein
MAVHSSVLLDIQIYLNIQQVLKKVLQHCKQCWIRSPLLLSSIACNAERLRTNVIIMDDFEILLCKAQQLVVLKNRAFYSKLYTAVDSAAHGSRI